MGFLKTLFSVKGGLIVLYVVIGVAVAGGQLPSHTATTGTEVHAWIQFFITIFLWPAHVIWPHVTFTF